MYCIIELLNWFSHYCEFDLSSWIFATGSISFSSVTLSFFKWKKRKYSPVLICSPKSYLHLHQPKFHNVKNENLKDRSFTFLYPLFNIQWILLTSLSSFRQQEIGHDKAGRGYLALAVFVVDVITADWITASPYDRLLAAGYGPSTDNVTSSENKLILLPDRVTVICHGNSTQKKLNVTCGK